MENKDYIHNIIIHLKDDRPAHAYAEMRRYMKHLGYTEDEIEKETTYITELLCEKNIEINKLRQKLIEKETAIQKILIIRKHTKTIYCVGLLIGIAGIIVGFFSNNIIYSIAGLGTLITVNGIYEANQK